MQSRCSIRRLGRCPPRVRSPTRTRRPSDCDSRRALGRAARSTPSFAAARLPPLPVRQSPMTRRPRSAALRQAGQPTTSSAGLRACRTPTAPAARGPGRFGPPPVTRRGPRTPPARPASPHARIRERTGLGRCAGRMGSSGRSTAPRRRWQSSSPHPSGPVPHGTRASGWWSCARATAACLSVLFQIQKKACVHPAPTHLCALPQRSHRHALLPPGTAHGG
jgi:hypothetical protein